MKKKCKNCGVKYERLSEHPPFRCWCSVECAVQISREAQNRQRAKQLASKKRADKAYKQETKARRLALKTKGDWVKEAQVEFNKFIRFRDIKWYLDRGLVPLCISCQKPCKKKNAGHYRSVGAAGELRFEEFNCNLQCEYCNTHLSANQIEYRINLIKKIGVEKVEWLEGPHKPKRYTIEDIQQIKALYKTKSKELQQELENLT